MYSKGVLTLFCFRQVKKHLETDKNATKWKKYDLIDRILRNLHRPKDAEPLPPGALEHNRDMTDEELREQNSITSNSNQEDCGGIMNMSSNSEPALNVEPVAINVGYLKISIIVVLISNFFF